MRLVTLASLRAHATRLVASTLAIVIAVAFVVATLVLNETSRATVLAAAGAEYVGTAAVVTSEDGSSLADDVATLGEVDAVRAVAATWQTSVQVSAPRADSAQYLRVDSIAEDPVLRWQRLTSGQLPGQAGEVAVSERLGAAVGDHLQVSTFDAEGTSTTVDVTVVGVVDLGSDPTAGLFGRAFATVEQARAWGALDTTELRVAGAAGVAPETVATEVRTALDGDAVVVRTGTAQAELRATELTGGTVELASVLLVFATIAVLVAGLVIANTFAVLLAQRTRELALLRCVGATARQVRRGVLAEAFVTGVAASAIGVLVGAALASGVSALATAIGSPVPLSGVTVPLYAVITGLLVGTAVTVVAALAPARAATRVAPLAAMRPLDPAPARSRHSVIRLVLGLLMFLPGIGILALGVVAHDVLQALAGGAVSFLGVVLLAQRAVPPVVALAGGLLGRVGGVPGRLAAGNATRNPRRTAATATALVIGVTLTTAMVVGAASTRATATADLEAAYPTDVVVEGQGEALPEALLASVLEGGDAVAGAGVLGAEVTGPDGELVSAAGYDTVALAPVLRSAASTPLPGPGELVVPGYLADVWGVVGGDQVTLTLQSRSLTGSAVVVANDQALGVPVTALRALAPDATIDSLWLRLADGDSDAQNAAVDQITDLAGSAVPSAQVTGLVSVRAALDRLLDGLLLVVTGLLGVAVVIALIGVGNTLALSVVERRQESGLLRALGLTRGQLRGLLAWEAVLVAGVAAVLGVALGVVYGLAGAASVLGEIGDVVLVVPWLQVAAIVAISAVAGLLASLLPARRAARTSPVAAIAG